MIPYGRNMLYTTAMEWSVRILISVAVLVAVAAATGVLVRVLRRRAILDHPNERSSHAVPTPRGGGWALVPIVLIAWVAAAPDSVIVWTMCVLTAGLAAVSWLDDLRGLSPLVRLMVHAVAVGIALGVMADGRLFFGGLLPPLLDRGAAALLWVWFINLFNFMDGIDGIAGVETVTVAGGAALIAALTGVGTDSIFGLTLAAGALGFLWWNWQPARIFLGDIGSVALGYLLGWLLLDLAADGYGIAALILPLYFLVDATLTLVRRGLRGEKVWQAHRRHFYQRAVQRGFSHATVSLFVAAAGVALAALAVLAAQGRPMEAAIAAVAVIAVLMTWLGAARAS